MLKGKLIITYVMAALVIIVLLQNTQAVETKFLFFSFTMSRAALLATTMLVGIAIGALLTIVLSGRKNKTDKE